MASRASEDFRIIADYSGGLEEKVSKRWDLICKAPVSRSEAVPRNRSGPGP